MAFNYGVFLANVNSRSRSLYAIARQSLSVVCLSPVVCLSVTLVRCTQPVEIFRNVSSPFGTLATRLTFMENFTEIVPGEPLRREG